MARRTEAMSSRSPCTTSAPSADSSSDRWSIRCTNARTRTPRSSRKRATQFPVEPCCPPAAPVTRMGVSDNVRLLSSPPVVVTRSCLKQRHGRCASREPGARHVTCIMQVLYGETCRKQGKCWIMNRAKQPRPVRRSDCAVACTLDLIGDRWTLLVVRDLLRGRRYFDEFLRSPEGIATNVLAARLRALCALGLVEKTPDPSDQRRYVYRLSDDGLRLRELLGAIAAWGLKYLPGTKVMGGIKPAQG